jgi:hypothetical protein
MTDYAARRLLLKALQAIGCNDLEAVAAFAKSRPRICASYRYSRSNSSTKI